MEGKILYKEIQDCGFSCRTKNCLIENGYKTVMNLVTLQDKSQLLQIKKFGKRSLEEVKEYLEKNNLTIEESSGLISKSKVELFIVEIDKLIESEENSIEMKQKKILDLEKIKVILKNWN